MFTEEHCARWGIPDYMHDGVLRYLNDGVIPGSFLHAVFLNDLYQTIRCADACNQVHLDTYGRMLNDIPMVAWGSAERVNAWAERGGWNGAQRDRAQD